MTDPKPVKSFWTDHTHNWWGNYCQYCDLKIPEVVWYEYLDNFMRKNYGDYPSDNEQAEFRNQYLESGQ